VYHITVPDYLVTLGDSVHWGQGLRREHKLHAIVEAELAKTHPGLVHHFLAHSGAIIGIGATVARRRVDGEVPVAYPTLVQQVDAFVGDPADVIGVLVNGSINDIDIRNILNPFVSQAALGAMIEEHSYDSMRSLLEIVLARFPNPATRIVVTPYYPILSPLSRPFGVPFLLANEGLTLPPGLDPLAGTNIVVAKCMQFWQDSTAALTEAVAAANATLAAPRVFLADAGFTEDNAVFAGDPWLFGLANDPLLSPQDEVVAERRTACDLAYPITDWAARQQCYRASAGHPNVKGARRYADAILAVIM
jgi:lysophospholipase L1-like esterase